MMVSYEQIDYAELDKIPRRHWDKSLEAAIVYVFPNKTIHDSGFMCMDFVAMLPDFSKVRFGGGCDSVSFVGRHFCMECMPNGIIRIFNYYGFTISADVSTIMFYENERKE